MAACSSALIWELDGPALAVSAFLALPGALTGDALRRFFASVLIDDWP